MDYSQWILLAKADCYGVISKILIGILRVKTSSITTEIMQNKMLIHLLFFHTKKVTLLLLSEKADDCRILSKLLLEFQLYYIRNHAKSAKPVAFLDTKNGMLNFLIRQKQMTAGLHISRILIRIRREQVCLLH